VTIGTLETKDYDRAAYEATSGIVSFRGDWSAIPQDATLELSQSGTLLLKEDPVRVIPIVNDIYVEEGQPHAVAYQIHVNGRPGGANQLLTVVAIDAEGNVVSTVAVAADDDGVVTLNLPASEPAGLMSYVPILPTQQPPTQSNGINTQLNTYVWVRRLSADPVTGRLPPTWDNVYTAVLANWNALAPCMDNWLDLHDEGQVRAYAAVLKTLTDPANFESFRFMPVTRDMTRGQRRLLYRFLDSPASPAHAEFEAQSVEKAGEPNFVALSRSLRKPSAGD
jgi:hypothetical protein